GAVTHEANRGLRDLSPREWALLVPIVVLIVWIGVYPTAFTGKTEATIEALIAQVQAKANVQRISLGPPTVAPGLRTPMECIAACGTRPCRAWSRATHRP